jgi:eukaryotic-like serine/threonine-protein kinase
MNLLETIELHLPRGFTIRDQLGTGATSAVYLAENDATGERLVVKVMRPGRVPQHMMDRFQTEMRILQKLEHPRIIPMLGTGEARGALFFTMPYVSGETLRMRLETSGPLSVRDTLLVARDLTDALGHAHARGVVHRDIKPANILLGTDGAYLMDFGFARPPLGVTGNGANSDQGWIIGTPDYMSPEQVEGRRPEDWRSDFFSLGCVMFEMLTGRPPFVASSVRATMRRRLDTMAVDVRSLRPDVPAAVAGIVRCNLEAHPTARYATAGFLRLAIDGALHTLDATADA